MQTKKPEEVPFLLVETIKIQCISNSVVETHKHLTFIAVFTMHAKMSLLYTFQRSMQAMKI